MPATVSTNKFTMVPPEIWAALRVKPGAPVRWEVRGGEAVMRPESAATSRTSVAAVAGMLAPKLKGRRIDWRAAEKSALAGWGKRLHHGPTAPAPLHETRPAPATANTPSRCAYRA